VLGNGIVPPNNQGVATPKYNKGDNGLNVAKDGVADAAALDDYTRNAVVTLGTSGYRAFAGQRDDAFYGDINSIFDLLALRSGPNNRYDSQGGFNVHFMILEIPLADIAGGDQQTLGVYATTSRRATTVLSGNRAVLDELADLLVEQETVDAEQLQELLLSRDVHVADYV
jgi:hypothetical protein